MNTNTIALDALKAAYITMQHMGNAAFLNNMDAVDEDEDAEHDAAFEAVRAAIAALEAQPQPEADMFWDHDDPESFGHYIQDLVAERDIGEEFRVDRAMRLPTIKVRVIAGETEDDYNTWEEVLPTPPKD
jgi:hypothetical protein